jgi:hypothetical protein
MAVVAAACLVLAGCRVRTQTERGPVSLAGSEVRLTGPDEHGFEVPSCNGDPEVDELVEDDDQVRIRVVTTVVVSGDQGDCLDGVEVSLHEPLGDRNVIDIQSGETLPVERRDADPGASAGANPEGDYPLLPATWTLLEPPEGSSLLVSAEVPNPYCREFLGWEATETDETVTIEAFMTQTEGEVCHDNIAHRHARIELGQPLGDRELDGCRPARSMKGCTELERFRGASEPGQPYGEHLDVVTATVSDA